MFNRWIEAELLDLLEENGVGCIAFSPLAKGILTDRYLNGIPADSRAASSSIFLQPEDITEEKLVKIRRLDELAKSRGQSLAQLALAWVLRRGRVTSALIGASKVSQIEDCVGVINRLEFSDEELNLIEDILK